MKTWAHFKDFWPEKVSLKQRTANAARNFGFGGAAVDEENPAGNQRFRERTRINDSDCKRVTATERAASPDAAAKPATNGGDASPGGRNGHEPSTTKEQLEQLRRTRRMRRPRRPRRTRRTRGKLGILTTHELDCPGRRRWRTRTRRRTRMGR